MPRVVHHPNGVIMINGRRYQRSQFAAAQPSVKDWLLWLMIMTGLVLSGLLVVTFLLGLIWIVVEMVRHIFGGS
jgi:hypothetical protein